MRKRILINILPLVLLFSLFSCKKNYSCECETTVSVESTYYLGDLLSASYETTTTSTKNINERKNKAEDICLEGEGTQTQNGINISGITGGDITTTTTCNIR